MSEVPDIRSLYQNKFISPAPNINNFPLAEMARSHKFRLISQRINDIQSRSTLKCVKIVKNPSEIRPLHVPKTAQCTRKNSKDILFKKNVSAAQSMHFPGKSNELIRQLIRVSQQQMGELQYTAGGEKNLRSMFQQFFQKRSKTNQKRRRQKRQSGFVPMHPPNDHQKFQYSRELVRRRKVRDNISQSAVYEKDLTPWVTPDKEFV